MRVLIFTAVILLATIQSQACSDFADAMDKIQASVTVAENTGRTAHIERIEKQPSGSNGYYGKILLCIKIPGSIYDCDAYDQELFSCPGGLPDSPNYPPNPPRCEKNIAGSEIDVNKLTLSESVAVAGTPFRLHYSTLTDPVRSVDYSVTIPIKKSWIGSGATEIYLDIYETDTPKRITFEAPFADGLTYTYRWNQKDSSGTQIYHSRLLKTHVTQNPVVTGDEYRGLDVLPVGGFDANFYGLGGWTLSALHFFDEQKRIMYKGDGSHSLVDWRTDSGQVIIMDPNEPVEYVFDESNLRHLETRNMFSKVKIYEFDYNASGHLVKITDTFGRETDINRNGSGDFTGITGHYGHSTTVTLNDFGRIDSITNPESETYSMTYHNYGKGLLKSFAMPEGQTNIFTYDNRGNLISDSRTGGLSQTFSTAFTASNQLTTKTTGENRTMTFQRDSLEMTGSHNRNMTYNQGNGVTTEVEERGSYVKTTMGEMSYQTTFAAGGTYGRRNTASRTVSNGNQTAATTESTSRTYYIRQNERSSFAIPFAAEPVFSYDVKNLVHSVTYPWGGTQTRTHDDPTDKITISSAESRVTTIDLSPTNSLVTKVDAPGQLALDFSYDTDGRLIDIDQGVRNTSYAYDADGNLASITNDLNQSTSFTYDDVGRLTRQTMPNSDIIDFAYDDNGNLKSIEPPGRLSYQYNYGSSTDYLDSFVPPVLSGVTDPAYYYYYDDDGYITSYQNPAGDTISYTYLTNSSLVDSISSGSETIDYGTYDSNGRPNDITSNDGLKNTLERDGVYPTLNALDDTVALQSFGEVNFSYTHLRLTNVSVKNALGTVVSSIAYSYDNDSLITDAGDLDYTINGTTGLTSDITLDNLDEDLTYNTFAEITEHLVKYSGTTKYSFDLTRDNLGRITDMTENVLGTIKTYDYDYDSNGRLTEVKENGVIIGESTYGTNSTRTSGKVNGSTFSATYDAHDRLTDWNDLDFAYNDNGEMISRTDTTTSDVTSYTWSPFGKLESVTLPSSDVITYKYDGFGRKAQVLLNGTLQYSILYQSQLRPVAQMDSSGNLIARFIWGQKLNTPEYMVKGGVKYRLVTDPRGSVRLVVKTTDGTVVQRLDYNEWGEVTSDTNPGFQPFGYAGGLYDHQTKLTEFGARHYDGEIGRWLSRDPIKFRGDTVNIFEYSHSDPINFTDPAGKRPISEWPRYGNWCGKNWCGGQRPSEHNGEIGNKGPIDNLDEACKSHDLCYSSKKPRSKCDEDFVNNLNEIKDDNWWKDIFRDGAKFYFGR